ncbi:hypothetical protein [Algoriphagus halophilus]|uniref:Outer membrane protein beta-barrel domain-containing protein n=1 Tax=Algoriphagus halophilus TaxID=226505 RepID=A0A1N6DP67_9BACT|nr:hypothetical protein [Algoriphagus halophilus]SIN72599.1 hypothetical protein SAMN05444394_1221 [Algoriphagus halophilus]
MKLKKLPLFILFYSISTALFAQGEDIFGISEKAKNPKSESAIGNAARNVLEMFSIELSTGAAYHQFSTPFYTANPDLYPNFSQFQNFDQPLDISEDNPLEMKSNDWTFPVLNAGLRINLFNLLTIGGGYGQEWGNMSTMRGGDFEFGFEGGSYQASKLYGTVGLVLFDAKRRQTFLKWKYRRYASANYYMQSELTQRSKQVYPWRFILEGEFGQLKMKNFVDQSVVAGGAMYEPKLAVGDKPYMGIALRIERDFSEYTKMFIKGGAEFRDFTYAASDFSEVQNLKQTLYGMQVGFAVRFPGTKRCKIAGCGVVMKHMHNGIEYRGSGIFNYQNRKVGQWY